jgi:hypothetical protein
MKTERASFKNTDKAIDKDVERLKKSVLDQFNKDVENGTVTNSSERELLKRIRKSGFSAEFGKSVLMDLRTNNKLNYEDIDKLVENVYDSFGFDSGIKKEANDITKKYNESYKRTFSKIGKEYKEIADDLINDVVSGKKSVADAAEEFKNKMFDKGLSRIRTLTGNRTMNTDAWFKMHVRTTHNKMYVENQREFMVGNNQDVLYISKHRHRKPRELCEPYEHTLISISGKTTEIEDIDGTIHPVKTWGDTSYGEPAGIMGINCTHITRIAYPGKFLMS